MSKIVNIRKGLDIKMTGEAELSFGNIKTPAKFALKPADFQGIRPKLLLRDGAKVKAGTPVFFDKDNEKVMFTSPVSGEITEVVRGAKRKLLEIRIEADGKEEYESFQQGEPGVLSREEIIENLLKSGIWPVLKQRPFDRIANPGQKPKAIFISAFDTSPLAPDYNFMMKGQENLFQKGLDYLKKLTDGPIHLNIPGKGEVSPVFTNARNVEINKVNGPHPAGNAGIQIHHISPVDKDHVVWHCRPQDVLTIAKLFTEGKYIAEKIFCLAGSEVKDRKYFKTINGANLEPYFENNIESDNVRYISGNVLTGCKIMKFGYLGYYDQQVTVIPEGDYYEFFGWIDPGFKKFSLSRALASTWLFKNKKKKLDTQMHGGERAYIVTGQYEQVLPMEIFPVQLIKAIMIEDIDLMEKLGIYEVAPEDMALCEVVCTSKTPVQEWVQKGIDQMVKELG